MRKFWREEKAKLNKNEGIFSIKIISDSKAVLHRLTDYMFI